MGKKVSIKQITDYLEKISVDYEIYGNQDEVVEGFSSVSDYKEKTITWLKKEGMKKLPKISVCVVQRGIEVDSNVKIVSLNSKNVFFSILQEFWGDEDKESSRIGEGTIIRENVQLGEDISIGCNCIIEKNVSIGKGTKIYHNVVIRRGTVIGEKCIIKSGTIIGEEGYGYSRHKDEIIHVPHFGSVVLGDEVEIGSNCSIDRGTIENTVIGKGSKIDNLCHIAHNVQIGKNVMVVANAVICGSACINDGAYIAPGGIIKNQIKVGEKCVIGMGSVVLNNTQCNKVLAGVPAKQLRDVGNEEW